MHAWGHFHEHTRADRDNYVKVHEHLIKDDALRNYEVQQKACTFGIPYDGGSIMHYKATANLKNNLPRGNLTMESLVASALLLSSHSIKIITDELERNSRIFPNQVSKLSSYVNQILL